MSTPITVIVPGKNPNGTDDSKYTVNVKPLNAAANAAKFNETRAAAEAAVAAAEVSENELAIATMARGEQPAMARGEQPAMAREEQPASGGRRNKRKATRRNKRKATRRNKRKGTRRNKRN
jgi:hypothetical protein